MNEQRVAQPARLRLMYVLMLAALLLAACGGSSATNAPKIPLKLAENAWTGSSININVAKILLEEKLGYKVEIVTIDENAQWAALGNGDLSASLEVWPSGHASPLRWRSPVGGLGTASAAAWEI